ncbi:hypothetical protein SteCoe_24485 [Stentor coeruleus]|uniref:Uncharacterized protein n=1 Tax=Stentor coeruleus TaxID=5963 RepID=A0A1R2BHF8_9CILI|nr:hypothetical protein SteCoe_24485 [Stentor coeruleus]
MVFFAFLICKIFALLTFKDVILDDSYSTTLSFTLVDESGIKVKTEKNLIIEPNPLVPFITLPNTFFTGSAEIDVWIDGHFTAYFKITCIGCEIYTTTSIIVDYPDDDFIYLISNTEIAGINEKITISFEDTYDTPFFTLYLIDQEDFDFTVAHTTVHSGTVTVSFFKTGIKKLLFYFMDDTWSDIDGISLQIESFQYYLIEFPSGNIKSFKDYFDLKFFVYSDENMVNPSNDVCDVTISLIPATTITGTKTKSLSGGLALFSSLLVKTTGIYYINILGSCISNFQSSETLTITGVNSIKISTDSVFILLNNQVKFTVTLLGPLDSEFNLKAFVTLKSSILQIIGTTSLYTSTGEAIFYITFNTIGETIITAFTDLDLATGISIQLNIYVLNSLCIESNNDLCIKCVDLANVINGQCVCVDSSLQIDVHCECIEGYSQIQNECVSACNNIFINSDVTGNYNQDYKSIDIKFSTSVVESFEPDCSLFLYLPDYLNYLFVECLWSNSNTMNLKFITILNGKEYQIGLDKSLTPAETKCNFLIDSLSLIVAAIVLPKPSIDLEGTDNIDLCQNDTIVIENKLDYKEYIYQWTANPTNDALDMFLSFSTTYKLEIPLTYTQEGVLNINCIVTNSLYNTSVNDNLSVTITKNQYASVGFNITSDTKFYKSLPIYIQGLVESFCDDNSTKTYKWEYLSYNPLNFESILANSPEPNILYIPKFTLDIGKDYSFKLTINIESISFNKNNIIDIHIDPIPLIITFDKISGTINKEQDLIVTATAIDLDSPDNQISYNWKCNEQLNQCFDSIGKTLEFNKNIPQLFVSKDKLRDNAEYIFTLTANTINKNNSEEIQFYVENSTLIIVFDKDSGNFSNNEDLIVTALAIDINSPDALFSYEWDCHEVNQQCKNNIEEVLEFNKNTQTLFVSRFALRINAHYIFIVKANDSNRTVSKNIEFDIRNSTQMFLSIQYEGDKNYENAVFYAVVKDIKNFTFYWSFNPQLLGVIPIYNSFISIPRKYLQINTDYNISLNALAILGNQLTSYYILTQPKTPTCSNLEVSFNETKWIVSVNSCTSENPKLLYQFGCITNTSLTLWFTIESYINSSYILIPSNCQNILAKICNGLSCTIIINSIPDGIRFYEDLLTEFYKDISGKIITPNAVLYYAPMITTQIQYKILILEMKGFFRMQKPSKSAGDVFISCMNYMILNNEFVLENEKIIKNLLEFIVSTYNTFLTSSQLLVIFDWLGNLTSILDFNSLSNMIQKTISIYFKTALPGDDPLILNSDLSLYAARVLAGTLENLNISAGENSLKILNTIVIDSNTIYDVVYMVYPQTTSDIKFEISFYTSGSYQDNILSLTIPKITVLDSTTISTSISGDFSSSKSYKCAYLQASLTWIENGCEILELSNKNVILSISHQSTFKVFNMVTTGPCKTGFGPIIITCSWLFFGIFSLIIFTIIDKNQKEENINKYTFYPIFSIFIRQVKGKRNSSISYLFFTHTILICMIGILLQSSEKPFEKTYEKTGNFTKKNIFLVFVAWILTQIIVFPMYYFIFNIYETERINKIAKCVGFLFSFSCVILVIFMNIVSCKKFNDNWVIDYFVFLVFQFLIEILYASIVWNKQNTKKDGISKKENPEGEELNRSNNNQICPPLDENSHLNRNYRDKKFSSESFEASQIV